jgi:hypothetical protein
MGSVVLQQQIIELQFRTPACRSICAGRLKRHWHFDYTLTWGKEKVLGEIYLIFTGYNLKRNMSIKTHLSLFFINLTSFITNMSHLKIF